MEALPPYQGGGSMIRDVHFEKTTYNDIPYKFEAGTPTIGEVVAFAPAIEFINELGKPAIHEHEDGHFQQAREGLKAIQGVRSEDRRVGKEWGSKCRYRGVQHE